MSDEWTKYKKILEWEDEEFKKAMKGRGKHVILSES